jgi:acetyl esterase
VAGRVVIVLAGAIVTVCALLTFGAFLPGVAYLGTAGTWRLAVHPTQYVLAALVGAGLALLAARLGVRRAGMILMVAGAVSALGAAVVLASQVATASRYGARVSVLGTLRVGSLSGAAPDETVTYTQDAGHPLLIDIYRPDHLPAATRAPVLVYTHGGGWVGGSRIEQARVLRWFAQHGFLAFSDDYSLASHTRATWGTAGAQVACAYSWVMSNAARLGGDPARIFGFGASAGGGLTLTTSYATSVGQATSSCGGQVPTLRAVAAAVPAVDPVSAYANSNIVFGPVVRDMVRSYLGGTPAQYPDRARRVATMTYLSPKAPPTVVFSSQDDHLVPRIGVDRLVQGLQQVGVDVKSVQWPFGDHGVTNDFYNVPGQASLQIMLLFFRAHGA